MENIKNDSGNWEGTAEQMQRQHRRGRRFAGLVFVIAGSLFIAKQSGVLIPDWLFTWQMLLIAFGLVMGVKHAFNGAGWLVPIIVGSVFMIQEFYPEFGIRIYLWPVGIILFGLMLIFKPKRMHRFRYGGRYRRRWEQHAKNWEQHADTENSSSAYNAEDRVDATAVFGEVKKNIISKDFKGGEVTCVFGGAEINLTQSDINGRVVIESTQVFGGAKFIVPRHWKVQSEMSAVFGGVQDKRLIVDDSMIDHTKILVIEGTCVFGGIEIMSF
jgi:predicted membrane protein